MARENTPYKLELTAQEFNELRSILHACDYFHQIGVMYNHVQHLERLFQEAERDANDYYMQEARELVSAYYSALNQMKKEEQFDPVYAPYQAILGQPVVKLVAHVSTLKNQRAAEFLRQNIPDGTVEWYFIQDDPDYKFEDKLVTPRSMHSDESLKEMFKKYFGEEPKKKLGFFEE